MKQYRQGDLLIQEVNSLPTTTKKVDSLVILRGEATGHSHRIESGQIFLDNGNLYLALSKGTRLVHDEHAPIDLPKGFYVVKRQREYTNKDATKLVTD